MRCAARERAFGERGTTVAAARAREQQLRGQRPVQHAKVIRGRAARARRGASARRAANRGRTLGSTDAEHHDACVDQGAQLLVVQTLASALEHLDHGRRSAPRHAEREGELEPGSAPVPVGPVPARRPRRGASGRRRRPARVAAMPCSSSSAGRIVLAAAARAPRGRGTRRRSPARRARAPRVPHRAAARPSPPRPRGR